jgi:hypothetical protein
VRKVHESEREGEVFFCLGAMSGWLLVLTGCSKERRTGRSACATERRVLARYYSMVTADMLFVPAITSS